MKVLQVEAKEPMLSMPSVGRFSGDSAAQCCCITCVTALKISRHEPCRRSGASDAPMPAKEAVPFASPESLAVEVELPHAGWVRGMGVRVGVTLVVGGGFHGKSTLLEALQVGVYNKARRRLLAENCEVHQASTRRAGGF